MIIVRLIGGHSNQLFQYAIGRSLAIKHKTDLKLDVSWFDSTENLTGSHPRHYELDDYPIKASLATLSELKRIEPRDKPPTTALAKLQNKLGRGHLIKQLLEGGLGFNKKAADAPDNVYLDGYWQNEKYFKNIRKELLKEFEPTAPMNKKNRAYLEKIQSSKAISLHVRREDYVENPVFNKYHGLTSIKYYRAAVNKVRSMDNAELEIFVFSKDIEWCKKNLKFDLPMTFVEGNVNGSDDMRLMKHCKHNIMANSSFSWWGAWLNQNPKKIVIAPKVWFLDEKSATEMDNIPKDWIRL